MTLDQLRRACVTLYGEQRHDIALAKSLGMSRTQAWRYLNGRSRVPPPVERLIESMLKRKRR